MRGGGEGDSVAARGRGALVGPANATEADCDAPSFRDSSPEESSSLSESESLSEDESEESDEDDESDDEELEAEDDASA